VYASAIFSSYGRRVLTGARRLFLLRVSLLEKTNLKAAGPLSNSAKTVTQKIADSRPDAAPAGAQKKMLLQFLPSCGGCEDG
jgi:hypothetical protein